MNDISWCHKGIYSGDSSGWFPSVSTCICTLLSFLILEIKLHRMFCVPFFFFLKYGLTVSLGWPSTSSVDQAGHGLPEISSLCLPTAGWCSCTIVPGTLLFDTFCVVLCMYIHRPEVRVRSLMLRDHSPLYFLRQNLSLTLEITGFVWWPRILLPLPSQNWEV